MGRARHSADPMPVIPQPPRVSIPETRCRRFEMPAMQHARESTRRRGSERLNRPRPLLPSKRVNRRRQQLEAARRSSPTGGDATEDARAGSSTAGSSTAGSCTAGSHTAGSNTAGSGTAGSGTAGSSTAGSSTAGSSTAGSSTAGSSTAGSSTAGSSTAGSSTAGSGTAGSSTAGSSTAGSSAAGSSTAGSSAQEAAREERLRAIGRQLDEEAARRDAATKPQPVILLPLSLSSARRYRLWGRSDPNAEIILYAEAWARRSR